MHKKRFNSLLPTALGIALLGLSSITQAATISATATWTLDGVNGTGSPDNQSLVGSGFVDILDSDSDSAGNNVFYHTFGNTTGSFGSRVSGSGNFNILGEFNFAETYQNTAASDQAAEFTFTVIPGELDVDFFGSSLGAADFILSAYEIDIRLNGISIWDSAGEVKRDNTGTTFSETGTSINGTFDSVSERYSWNDFTATIDLGIIGAGETFLLEYDMRTTATSSLTSSGALDCTGFGGGGRGDELGDEVLIVPGFGDGEVGGGGLCGSAISRSGDPFDPTFLGSNAITVSGASAVPEPATMLLLGLGLTGMFAARRKQA